MPETRFFINEIVIFENNRTNIVAILSPKAFYYTVGDLQSTDITLK